VQSSASAGPEQWSCCGDEQKMLILEPSRRITARTALEHEYFKDVGLVP
jgi:hypothetical protein